MAEALTNKLGHRIRTRGQRTRGALLAAVRDLLEERGPGEVRVADVAARAGVSAPSVYTYFGSIDEAVLALCEAAGPETDALAVLLEGDWSGEEAFRAARTFVEAMAAHWARHGAALRLERLMADRGDAAFAESRIRRLRRLHLTLERRIARARAAGFHPTGLDPRLASYEVVSLVESVGAGIGLLRRAEGDEAILDTTAHMVVRLVTGR
jgi:AcrR family transcriptional regulator